MGRNMPSMAPVHRQAMISDPPKNPEHKNDETVSQSKSTIQYIVHSLFSCFQQLLHFLTCVMCLETDFKAVSGIPAQYCGSTADHFRRTVCSKASFV